MSKETEVAKALLEQFYDVQGELKHLAGYDNQNFKVTSPNGKCYILKVYFDDFDAEVLACENTLLDNLRLHPQNHLFPELIHSKTNQAMVIASLNDRPIAVRLLSFLEGSFLADTQPGEPLLNDFGKVIGSLDKRLANLKLPALEARTWIWDHLHFEMLSPFVESLTEAKDRRTVKYFLQQFQQFVRPLIPQLSKGIVHGDPNDHNVLASRKQITGLIDFGDIVHTAYAVELGVTLAYLMMREDEKEEFLPLAQHFIGSYQKENPLNEVDYEVLYYFIAARACTSLTLGYYNYQKHPENKYYLLHAKPAGVFLQKWLSISPIAAASAFKRAASFNPTVAPSYTKATRERAKHISKAQSLSYTEPIQMERAAFQYMYDVHGHTYLDAYNNIKQIGHCHPALVEAACRQIHKLNTNTRYLYDSLAEYAAKISDKMPAGLDKVFFVNSGSAASDLAIRMARAATGHRDVVVLEHGYHGNTQLGIDISHYKHSGKGGQGAKDWVHSLPLPSTYRGKHAGSDEPAKAYLQELELLLEDSSNGMAAFICEPIVGCGGQVPLCDGFLPKAYQMIRHQGGLCISDEVQTGFGRVGKHFWGFELYDVVPDIVVLGKPMGNGHPIGAVVTSQEIAAGFENGMEFFSSFGGNPVSCEIGKAVLQVIDSEGLQANSLAVGNYFKQQLSELQQKHSMIADIRGEGLFLGIEFGPLDKPATTLTRRLLDELRGHRILSDNDGPYYNVIKIKPPLCFNHANVDQYVGILDLLLGELE